MSRMVADLRVSPGPDSIGGSAPRLPGEREILDELNRLHARVLRRMPLVHLLVAAAVSYSNYRHVPGELLAGWSAAMLLVELLRSFVAGRVLRTTADPDPRRTHTLFVVLAGLSGLVVGSSAVLFFPYIPVMDQVLLAIIYFAMASGGAAVSASSQMMLAAYLTAMLGPANHAWAGIHPEQALVTVGTSILYCGFMILIAGDGERLLTRSIAIRKQRDLVVRDLEQRNADVRAAMARAEQSAETRARVLAAASHDLRQPLHALSIYSAILAENPTAETLREVGENIDHTVRSLGNLIGGLLDLSRLSSGYYVPDRQVFMLDALVGEVCRDCEGPALSKNLRLERDLPPVLISTDPTAVSRIARNLVDNAIKYTDSGQVRVRVRRAGPSAVLEVGDTGKGIPPADQERVFEEFYQVDNPGRDRSRGVGLGLAIVQRLCELIDADIRLESTPGVGTLFEVTFRNAVVSQVRGPAPAGIARTVRMDGRRIYLVDDEIDIVRSMRLLLRQWGVQVEAAGSSEAAAELFERHGRPDLMIADLRLGAGEHGAALASRLRERHGDFPVLIITGETSSEALLEANRAGYPLLQKPITQETLKESIAALLAP